MIPCSVIMLSRRVDIGCETFPSLTKVARNSQHWGRVLHPLSVTPPLVLLYKLIVICFSLFIKSGAACYQARSLWRIECFKIKYEIEIVLKNFHFFSFLDGTVVLLVGVH